MAAVLDHVADRLKAGAKADLLELAKITFVKSRTARVFYDNGFKSVASIANADPMELVPVLMQVRVRTSPEHLFDSNLFPGPTYKSATSIQGRSQVRGEAFGQSQGHCRFRQSSLA